MSARETEQHPKENVRVRADGSQRKAGVARLPHWWLLPCGLALGAVAGAAYGELHTPQYAATSYVVVVPAKESDAATALGYAQAYSRVAVQSAVLESAHARAGVSADALRRSVQAATSPDAPMIAVTGTATRPRVAADLANAVTRSLIMSGHRKERSTDVDVKQFVEAVPPPSPVSISPALAALVGSSAGGLLGGLTLLVRPQRRPGDNAPQNTPAAVPRPSTARDEQAPEVAV
ncbi:lipopolysaccharide biosynthesis protein [Streptomyces sp. NPDC001978]|uniref:lipopolysaccharide biosynthesis protein n=1 Tax=Streptomyces sp. NPDC001978 TaxID=3364627 RepID=UPI0036799E28